jgi:threonine dehydrogenase-like Zn-dependent dehydrogenase
MPNLPPAQTAAAANWRLRVAVADLSQRKLEMALEGGAEIAVAAENAGRTLQKEQGGVDAAIVMTASPAAIQQALRAPSVAAS